VKVEIITIGDELLIGQVVDTNSAWMGQQLNLLGFEVGRINSISDSEEEILSILDETSQRAQVVLITGGLGPTKDDITKHTLCKYFKTDLVFNEEVFEDIKEILKRYVGNINELNRQQAMVPANCKVIRNPVGTAPIMWFEKDGVIFISMPGVPSEMKYAMSNSILQMLADKYTTGAIVHKTVLVHNIPEAVLAEMLEEFERTIPIHIKLAYLPAPGKIRLRFTARGISKSKLEQELVKLVDGLKPIIGNNILAYEDITAVELIAGMFKSKKLTLSTAESCTGGNIARQITSLSGSSEYFKGSVVAYHNHVKQSVLGVSEVDLMDFGAVSKPVVEQMATGIKNLMATDYSVATSGIAGPDGGTEEKPVGTVWIAVAGPNSVVSEKFQFGGIRERVIIRSTEMALVMLKKMVDVDSVLT